MAAKRAEYSLEAGKNADRLLMSSARQRNYN